MNKVKDYFNNHSSNHFSLLISFWIFGFNLLLIRLKSLRFRSSTNQWDEMDHSKNVTSTKPLEALESPYQIFLICLYSFTACFAFVSNFVTIIVMVKGKRCSRDLKKFLINLSVTDLLMAVFTIPFTYTNYMLGRWIFFSLMCPLVNCAQLTTITVSIYTLVAIAIDRYVEASSLFYSILV